MMTFLITLHEAFSASWFLLSLRRPFATLYAGERKVAEAAYEVTP